MPEAFYPAEAADDDSPRGTPPPDQQQSPILPAVSLPKFCTACGAPWQPDWTSCPVCLARQERIKQVDQVEAAHRSGIAPTLWLYFVLLSASAAALLVSLGHLDQARLLIALTTADSLIILGWTIWAWRDIVPALTRKVSPIWLAAGAAAGCGTFALATIIIGVLHQLFGLQSIDLDSELFATGGWTLIILLVCVQPAIFEELGFRGVVLPGLQPALAPREAVIVSALLFMTLHLMVGSFPHLFVMGLILGYLRVKTGSLLPGMLMHFVHNLLCVLLANRWS